MDCGVLLRLVYHYILNRMFQTNPNVILLFISAIVQVTYATSIHPDVWEPLGTYAWSLTYLN